MKTPRNLTLSGSVKVSGRPLPSGLATLAGDPRPWAEAGELTGRRSRPGPTERHLIRLEAGKFRFRGLSPGNYVLKISPLGLLAPMSLAYKDLPSELNSYRLSLEADGRAAIYDSTGVLMDSMTGLELSSFTFVPPKGSVAFKGVVRFPEDAAADIIRDPVLILIQVNCPRSGLNYHFHWLEGTPDHRREKHFAFLVQPGRLQAFQSWSKSWAVRPCLMDYKSFIEIPPSRTAIMKFEAKKGAAVRGSVSHADPDEFRIDFGRRSEKHGICFVSFRTPFSQDWVQHFVTDDKGRYKAGTIFPGTHAVTATHATYAGTQRTLCVSPENSQLARFSYGRDRVMDLRLPQWADLRMEIDVSRLPEDVPDQSEVNIIGYYGGLPAPRGISVFDACFSGFCFRRGWGGMWEHHDNAAPAGLLLGKPEHLRPTPPGLANARIRAGRYDVLIVQIIYGRLPSARVLTAKRTLVLNKRRVKKAGWLDGRSYPSGDTELSGSFGVCRAPGLETLRAARSMRELGALAFPQADLYDAGGRYRGTAFASLSAAGILHARRQAEMEKLYARPLAFQIKGLSAGRYKARVFAYGAAVKTFAVTLAEGKRTRLDAATGTSDTL
jgi:hypothetical protein